MDKILIVEDDLKLQKFLQTQLQKQKEEFEIITANNGEEAIKVLEQKYISLLVTGIQMPKVDGLNFLVYITKKYPHIPCIVMSDYVTPESDERLSDDSIFCFLKKPFHFDDLMQAILQALEQDIPDGTIKGIAVSSFLQMIEMEEKTCLFEVHSPGKGKGLFYFQKGIPYNAIYGDLKGEDAAYELIVMDKAEIRFRSLPKKKLSRRINQELMGLIVEATRRKEESDG